MTIIIVLALTPLFLLLYIVWGEIEIITKTIHIAITVTILIRMMMIDSTYKQRAPHFLDNRSRKSLIATLARMDTL